MFNDKRTTVRDTFETDCIRNGGLSWEEETTPLLERTSKPEASRKRKAAVMFSCLVQQFVSVGIGYGLSIMYAELIKVFDVRRSEAALVQGLYLGLSVGSGILFTSPIKKIGPGLCIIFGSIVCSGGFLASAFAANIWTVIICAGIVSGLGMCVCYLSGFIVVSWIFPKNPGLPLVCLTLGSSFGQFVVPALFELFIASYTWKGAFILISAIALQCFTFGLIIHDSNAYYVTENDNDKSYTQHVKQRELLSSLCSDILIWILLINYLFLALTGNVENWFIVDIMVNRGYPRQSGSIIVSLIGFGNLVGRVIGTLIRFKCTKIPTVSHWMYICPIMALAHGLVVTFQDYWLIVAACVLQGVSFGVTNAQSPAIMYEAAGLKRYPEGMALANVMYGFGNLFSNIFGGLIRDELGEYNAVFYGAVACSLYMALGAAGATLIIKRRKRRNAEMQ